METTGKLDRSISRKSVGAKCRSEKAQERNGDKNWTFYLGNSLEERTK